MCGVARCRGNRLLTFCGACSGTFQVAWLLCNSRTWFQLLSDAWPTQEARGILCLHICLQLSCAARAFFLCGQWITQAGALHVHMLVSIQACLMNGKLWRALQDVHHLHRSAVRQQGAFDFCAIGPCAAILLQLYCRFTDASQQIRVWSGRTPRCEVRARWLACSSVFIVAVQLQEGQGFAEE